MSPELTAYDEGHEAQRDGFPRHANPHPPGSRLHARWEEGWDVASDEEESLKAAGYYDH